MNITEAIVDNVVETRFESLDAASVQNTKLRILDAVGCAIAGANAAGCNMLLDLVKRWSGPPESTVLVHGWKGPSLNAAMVNSLMIRSHDFEPVEAEGENTSSPAHISGTTVSTALSMAEKESASGKDLITALALGDDLAARLAVASGFNFDLGWDNTGTVNVFGATAIAAKLLGLNRQQVRNAFGIAVNQLAGTLDVVWAKTMAFKLPIALASRNGIFAAELAQQGFSGIKDPFLGAHGYFAMYCRDYNTNKLIKDLGQKYYADCVHKPYSCCRATHPSIDCALKITAMEEFKVENIINIKIYLNPSVIQGFTGQPFIIEETPQISGAFSIRYAVANALLRKGVRPEHFSEENIRHPQIKNLIDKMELVACNPGSEVLPTEIHVALRDGKVMKAHTGVARGDRNKNPLSLTEIEEKFRSSIQFSGTVSLQSAEETLKTIKNLEELRDIRELIKLLS
jgi:2-methylcitrate dehydratase PrpD